MNCWQMRGRLKIDMANKKDNFIMEHNPSSFVSASSSISARRKIKTINSSSISSSWNRWIATQDELKEGGWDFVQLIEFPSQQGRIEIFVENPEHVGASAINFKLKRFSPRASDWNSNALHHVPPDAWILDATWMHFLLRF